MSRVFFDHGHHEFSLDDGQSGRPDYDAIRQPLSVIVQVTRRCPLECSFCSESDQFEDPSFDSLSELKTRLKGVNRIYLSGGEPLLREDIFRLIKCYRDDFPVVGLPTNCIFITPEVCRNLQGKVSYINAGLDGPRHINDRIRGGYDKIIAGLNNLKGSGIEVSLSTVILKETLPYLQYVVQIADILGVIKVKMVVPVLRGRAKNLKPSDFACNEDIAAKFAEIVALKNQLGWKPRIKFTFWDKSTEGYALLVYPDKKVYAWPVLGAPDSVLLVGDLANDSIQDVWSRYPYRKNHVDKYVGLTMHRS